MTLTRIGSDQLSAAISPLGAELTSLETADGLPLLWNGDPAWWTGRSPLLFPIVGRVPGDEILIEGRRYPLKQHGFARTSMFARLAASQTRCSFRLAADAATRAVYPFAFVLDVHYEIAGATLTVRVDVTNEEPRRAMPFSFGFHPALRWPLHPGTPKDAHDLLFSHPEIATVARPRDGFLAPQREANPVDADRVLHLRDAMFEAGALVFDTLASDAVRYRTGDGSSVRISFSGMPHLGIWSKPGAPFVCIEPWHGFAAPEGFAGELGDKPGIIQLAPGARHSFKMLLSVAN